ncbi:MAG: cytochrome d ubiquinol oxidase subunit II [Pseudorhodoplanes sp.]
MDIDLPLVWAGIIGAAVALYVILDGFDLGIGMLFPMTEDEKEREQMLTSIAPFWDGNETWLVMGGAGLLVAFPKAYAVIMPALYIPLIVMLLALVFRGVTFEFRGIARRGKFFWDIAFSAGSMLAAYCQGLVLGGLLQGIKVVDGHFAGTALDWATPFAITCGLGVMAGYALLGATWLAMKLEGPVAERALGQARFLLLAVLFFMTVVSIWTPISIPRISERWFSVPNIYYLSAVPILAALAALCCWVWLKRPNAKPFFCAIVLFLLGYAGLAISNYPYIVPTAFTIHEAAAARESQIFMLVGTAVLLPLTLIYTALVYWVFRGRVKVGATYHAH